ncbi:MAG: 2-isopropylmalate synthase [Candidatus Omnitrophica bacterium]|nr:2-isopropylmalate synthase [Candidatus Omnitrophota bacterium]
MDKIIIFDTTLRDGEQSPGASLDTQKKLEIAHQLARLGVDVLEAGFPISSPDDFRAVQMVAKQVKGLIICGLARAIKKDIDAADRALHPARRKRIHVFLATSKIHLKYKLKKADAEILRLAVESVKYARNLVEDVEFSPEDASRTDKEFLFRVVEAAIAAGAGTINIPDTVGYAIPEEFGRLIAEIRENVSNIDRAVLSVHCHNDLGLGVANSLAAIANGAGQVECTINGLGERAGNASLEEIVMALRTRCDYLNKTTNIRTAEIYKTSRLVSKLTGIMVQPNKAIVGQNAFRHEAGIHQDGVLKRRVTYEIMRPQDVGLEVEGGLVLGKHSGRHAFSERLKKMGFHLSPAQIDKLFFQRFKQLADKKKEIFDEDLITLVEEEISVTPKVWQLVELTVASGNKVTPYATIKLKSKGKTFSKSSSGDGPVDACYKAIDKITGIKGRLLDYSIQAVTRGKDAQGEVHLLVQAKGKEISGRSSSTDIIEASAKAYLDAINKLLYRK